jgi:hypothetical protein
MNNKRKRSVILLGLLVLVGISYNIYLILKPNALQENTEVIDMGRLNETFNSMGIEDSTLMELSLSNPEFQAFLDSADIILKDSMNCNCPDKYNDDEIE